MSSQLPQKHFRVRQHLRPFFPYIDQKANSSTQMERTAPKGPHAIDVDRLKLWLDTCQASHGDHCQATSTDDRRRPRRLIDTVDRCIVDAHERPYACFSYVWGQVDCRSLTKSLVKELQLPNSLGQEYLPRTIEDAVHLVPLLGLRYLWVDRLCIVQDDQEDKEAQISIMSDIYAGSTLTIIAANANKASAPLWTGKLVSSSNPGIESTWRPVDSSQSRCQPQERRKGAGEIAEWVVFVDGVETSTGEFCDESPELATSPWPGNANDNQYPHDDIMHMLSTDLIRSQWNDRGWTFQEWHSSHRRLVFHDQSVNWDCHCASWHEAQVDLGSLATCKRQPPVGAVGLNMERWPNWYRFVRMVCQFNIRQLTYPEDVLDAIEGALSSLSTAFSGGFISGLPRMFFDAALLWQPYAPGLQRRQPKLREAADAVLPSWSWVACHGNLDSVAAMVSLLFAQESDDHLEASRTFSTVAWEHGASRDGPWEAVTFDSMDPGDGWSAMREDATGREYFTHALAPGQRFWYPVKICDTANNAPSTSVRSRFLRGRTRHAKLLADGEVHHLQTGHLCPVLGLRDATNRWAGFLRLGDLQTAESLVGRELQLIELSRGETKNLDCPFLQSQDVVVNVMCVMDVDGVFYRLAVGRVDRSVWADQDISELREVVIG